MKIIDTRDLHDRLEELKDKQDEIQNKKDEIKEAEDIPYKVISPEAAKEYEEELEDLVKELEELESDFDADEREELNELENMESEIPEWRHGETLIPENYWIEYCEELCKDIGYISDDFPWWIEIDWSATAENIKADYSEIEYQGTTYLYRSC